MLQKKKGYPADQEFVMCTVTKIQFNSVFVRLDEYDKQGMIHISEISPGRIRNIRDYVREGKVVVCTVLRVNQERGQIDLSLRRVNEAQRRNKLSEVKQEQKAEKILEVAAKVQKKPVLDLYIEIMAKLHGKYSSLYDYFEDIVAGDADIKLLDLPKALADSLDEIIRQRIKLPEVEITGNLFISSYQPAGVDIVRDSLRKFTETGGEMVSLHYVGAGKYPFKVKAPDYKTAEKTLKKSADAAVAYAEKHKSEAHYERIEK
jgi:translation initiation factor 2 subunit 1